jgi:hypothetical protein
MYFVGVAQLILLLISILIVVRFSLLLKPRDHIRCPTDRIDPSKTHGNQEPNG